MIPHISQKIFTRGNLLYANTEAYIMQITFGIKFNQSRKKLSSFIHYRYTDELLYDVYLTLHTLTFQNKIEENIADV